MDEEVIDLPDSDPLIRELVTACEVGGRHTRFTRGDSTVAVLVSWDEYLSLKETVEIAADPDEVAAIGRAEDEVRRGATLSAGDLFGD